MGAFNLGDKNGRYCARSFGFRDHLRPAHHDLGSCISDHNGLLDHVGADVGEGRGAVHFRSFRIPSSEERKDK